MDAKEERNSHFEFSFAPFASVASIASIAVNRFVLSADG